MDRASAIFSGVIAAILLAGLWFVSSTGVEEGLVFGPGRWWLLFVVGKAFSVCCLLLALFATMGLALRRFVERTRIRRLADVFR